MRGSEYERVTKVPRFFFNCGLALAKRRNIYVIGEMCAGKCKCREIGVNLGNYCEEVVDGGGVMLCVTGIRTDRKGSLECKPTKVADCTLVWGNLSRN
jgi:hypothetical protein